ncbi:hypothetical protein [Phenylobacterium sp.]|uniref:hypothetical protein n=1 Tax=Phenylobacterium sp. TaxID=1871053 RepID=UPI0025CCAD8A|nr:hypothetical protein [Phenylobacterium sp.]
MSRPLSFLVLAALAGAPVPALAQTWPAAAITTASVQGLGPASRAFALNDRAPARAWRAAQGVAAPARVPEPPAPKLRGLTMQDRYDDSQIDIRAKDTWHDDEQGFRLDWTNVVYKHRF